MSNVSLPIDQLRIGHYIHLPIGWASHPFMLNSFLVKDNKQLAILRRLGLKTITVDVERSEITDFLPVDPGDTPVIGEEGSHNSSNSKAAEQQTIVEQERLQQIQQQQQTWWKQIRTAQTNYQTKVATLKDIYSKLTLQPDQALMALEGLAGELMTEAEQQGEHDFALCNNEVACDALYQNALNVAVLSTKLAHQLALSHSDCAIVTKVALLSHFGMLWVPATIRNKKTELTKPELNYLKQHPAYANQKLQDTNLVEDVVLSSVLQLNEKLDGSGFPRGLTESKINKFAQLIGITIRYNEMCNANILQQRYSPHLVIAYLFKVAGKRYNKVFVEQFVKMMGVYPIGSIVSYQDCLAQVQMNITASFDHPLLLDFSKIEPIKKLPLLLHSIEEKVTIERCVKLDDVKQAQITKFNLEQRNNVNFSG